jgi:hypothetical protein
MKTIVDNFNLSKWVGEEEAHTMLLQAGYRGQAPYVTYLFFRMVMPVVMLVLSLFYVFVVIEFDQPPLIKVAISIGAAYFGMLSPNLFLRNQIQRRQASIKRAFPDALDLLLICVESGMAIEPSFRKVSEEIGTQSIPLAEELALTTAELSFLPDRRQAYENLARRTGLEGVKAVCLALQQAERYGTPLGTTMRVLAQENRDMHVRGREEGRRPAAEADGADDPVLPAGAVRRDSRSGCDPGDGAAIGRRRLRSGTVRRGCERPEASGGAGLRAGDVVRGRRGAAMRQHLPQIGDVGGRLFRRELGTRDRLRFREAAL